MCCGACKTRLHLCWCCLRGMAPTVGAPGCFGPGGGCLADTRLIALPATPDADSGGHWQLGQQWKATRRRRLAATASFGATKAARSPDGPDLNESAAGAASAVVAGGSEREEGQSPVRAAHYGTANGLAATVGRRTPPPAAAGGEAPWPAQPGEGVRRLDDSPTSPSLAGWPGGCGERRTCAAVSMIPLGSCSGGGLARRTAAAAGPCWDLKNALLRHRLGRYVAACA